VPSRSAPGDNGVGKVDQDLGDQVAEHEVEFPLDARKGRSLRAEGGRHAVLLRVLRRHLDRDGVGVYAEDPPRAQERRGDAQDPGARADVEDRAGRGGGSIEGVFHEPQAHPRGLVRAGP